MVNKRIMRFLKGKYLILILCLVLGILHKNKKWGSHTDSWNNICSDGRGYYAWLPATFIYGDLNFGFHYTVEKDESFMPNQGCYQDYINTFNGKSTNKYYPGAAICMLPFFGAAHLYCKLTGSFEPNGYTTPYFIANGIAGMCWLYIGMYFFWQVLTALKISELIKTITSLIILFGSNAIFFSVDAPSYSHVYSFGLVTIFIWLSLRFLHTWSFKFLYLMAFFIGWIFITRPVNVSILILIPFLFSDKFFNIVSELWRKPINMLVFMVCGLILPVLLFSLYKVSTGSFIVYSYGEEGFDFSHPHIWDFLTSYQNGLVKYVPALVIPFLALYWTLKGKYASFAWGCVATIVITVYIHASWWYWSYGGSFGPRTLLDFLAVFGVLIALGLSVSSKWIVYIQYAIYLLCIVFTMLLHDQKTHGRMNKSLITSNEYWGSVNSALDIK